MLFNLKNIKDDFDIIINKWYDKAEVLNRYLTCILVLCIIRYVSRTKIFKLNTSYRILS